MSVFILKPPLCVGMSYRRSDYGAPNVQLFASRCYPSSYTSRPMRHSPAASLLYVRLSKKVESTGECGYVH
ncbi:Uncharacterised protein [Leminorella richardii]|uniref:Uncharacterized protein n=1 Tax=Leminorella richardii TaxID=158841 RepID=A0A2X4URI3_9GAMM|nr:Uncharacterised protein [Leminorella richardii]